MIFENWAERFVHLAAHQVNPVETIGAQRRAALDHPNEPFGHFVAPAWELVAQEPGEQHGPVSHPRVVDAPVPSEINFLDRAAETFEYIESGKRISADLRIDAVEPEVHRVRDSPAFDVLWSLRKYDLFANGADVIKVRAGHDVLHQRSVGNAACHRPIMQYRLQRMIEVERIAPEWRLVSDSTCQRMPGYVWNRRRRCHRPAWSSLLPAAAPAPPEEPPGVYSRFHGLRVMPQSGLAVIPV